MSVQIGTQSHGTATTTKTEINRMSSYPLAVYDVLTANGGSTIQDVHLRDATLRDTTLYQLQNVIGDVDVLPSKLVFQERFNNVYPVTSEQRKIWENLCKITNGPTGVTNETILTMLGVKAPREESMGRSLIERGSKHDEDAIDRRILRKKTRIPEDIPAKMSDPALARILTQRFKRAEEKTSERAASPKKKIVASEMDEQLRKLLEKRRMSADSSGPQRTSPSRRTQQDIEASPELETME
jgi:hypothetical protein